MANQCNQYKKFRLKSTSSNNDGSNKFKTVLDVVRDEKEAVES